MQLVRHRRRSFRPDSGSAGFTLIELMVTIAVLGILLALAAPSMENALLGSKLGSHANKLVSSTIVARSEAIKRNAVTTLCASSNGTSCAANGDWDQGWIVLAGTTVIERQQAAPTGFRIIGRDGANAIIRTLQFQPTGVGATQATLLVCRATPSAGLQERRVFISATGRPSTDKTTTGTCA